jgi:xanthine phosphoribosyltransferase
MKKLQERIIQDGVLKSGDVLKVDSFLNHQIDVALLEDLAAEFHRRFADLSITKVLTIESSGIAIAYPVARAFGVPLLTAKKSASVNLDGDLYVAEVDSYARGKHTRVMISKKYLTPADRVLIIDDFLANGCTLQGLISIVEEAEASVEGCGIAIEKGYLEGGQRIRNLGYRLESLAIIDAMDPDAGTVTFRTEQ